MEKLVDSMVIVARGASRNVRIYPLTVLFTFTMVIIINCILGLISSSMNGYKNDYKNACMLPIFF